MLLMPFWHANCCFFGYQVYKLSSNISDATNLLNYPVLSFLRNSRLRIKGRIELFVKDIFNNLENKNSPLLKYTL